MIAEDQKKYIYIVERYLQPPHKRKTPAVVSEINLRKEACIYFLETVQNLRRVNMICLKLDHAKAVTYIFKTYLNSILAYMLILTKSNLAKFYRQPVKIVD